MMNLDETQQLSEKCRDCWKNPHYLIIDKTKIGSLVAGIIFGSFFIFCAGYFFGKSHNAQELCDTIDTVNFSDHIDYAFSNLQNNNAQELELADFARSNNDVKKIEKVTSSSPEKKYKYAAQLLGGTQKQVNDFVNRMNQKGIVIEARKRISTTSSGKTMYWYQAVTPQFDQENELENVLNYIKKFEKLTDIQIVKIPTEN